MPRTLSPAEVRALLTELVAALSELGGPAAVYVIGGAAICLLNPARTTTNDIDGYIRHVDATETISALQRKWGLEADWFNWHAQGLQPPVAGEDMFTPYTSEGQVVLYVAKADALLAMKLFASRAKDQPDIDFLLALCGVDSVDQAEEVFDRYYPGEGLSRRAIARVEHSLNARTT